MNVEKYSAKSNLEILNRLFLKGDFLYASESFHVMNGKFGYARKIFDENKAYLGMVDDKHFPEKELKWTGRGGGNDGFPNKLEPVLAEILHVKENRSWYEVISYNGTSWCTFAGSNTFLDGERVVKWKYCKDCF